jgi:tetratricopeptide (TPR) repeat protein
MQSGRFPTQRIWEIMAPFSEESWKEVWYPITRIGGPFYANREAAFSLLEQGVTRLGVQGTRAHTAALLRVESGAEVVWEKRVDLVPGSPVIEELKPAKALAEDASVSLRDAEGRLLARGRLPGGAAPELPIRSFAHIEARENLATAEELYLAGRDREKLGEMPAARDLYERALAVAPGFSSALTALGVLDLRQGLIEEALRRFRAVLQKDPSDEQARFSLAAGLLAAERFAEAAEELKLLARSRGFRAGSSCLLGGIHLAHGELSKAEERLGKCAREFPWLGEASALLACCLRRQGRYEEARQVLRAVLERDPLHFLSLAETFFLAGETAGDAEKARAAGELEKATRGEPQSYLETACDYARVGLYQEAFDLLVLHGETARGQAEPFVHYHLGYYAEKIGRKGFPDYYRRGSAGDPRWVFPHRVESERVLLRARELEPQDGRLAYYLGTLLCAKDRPEEAIRLWEQAAVSQSNHSVLRRNLGRAYWKVRRDPDRAIAEYREAIRSAPRDYKLYLELEKILASCGLQKERRALLEGMPAELAENDLIAERVAAMHADCQDFDGALGILLKVFFFPWEVYKGVRWLYVDCCVGKGIRLSAQGKHAEAIASFQAVMSYPRNIGVGEPYRKANAEAWLRIGVARHAMGDAPKALECWRHAADEPRPAADALCYYQARALQRLGRAGDAEEALLPLVSSADPYLAGLAAKGMGDPARARVCFSTALAANPAHRRARWELDGFTGED